MENNTKDIIIKFVEYLDKKNNELKVIKETNNENSK